MEERLIRHYQRGVWQTILKNGEAEIMLEVGKDDVDSVLLCYYDKYLFQVSEEFKEKCTPMTLIGSGRYSSFYRARVKPIRNRLHYYFKITFTNGETLSYNASGLAKNLIFNEYSLFSIPYINKEDCIATPDWARDSICYQIFPDTFNSLTGLSYTSNEEKFSRRFSHGTLNGIKAKIPYLKDLGINLLYLTPIFKSNSNHRYGTIDYYEIDPMLGTKDDFKALVNECHNNGIRIILDGVFNHTSTEFFAFEDILKNQEKSKYKDWYHIIKYPVERNYNDPLHLNYETFSYSLDMPKLNTMNPEVLNYILGVAKYWVNEFNIDGWRLDVANEIPLKLWRIFRDTMKGINEDLLLIGESWTDSSCYLMGDTFDSVMNYLFRDYTLGLFDSKLALNERIKLFKELYIELICKYPSPAYEVLINLLASHDVDRLRDTFKDERIIRVLTTLQMTATGIPSIYYGDEMGMKGDNVFSNRAPVDFNKINKDILNYYKSLIKIRNENISLRRGSIEFIELEGALAYKKKYNDNELLIIINLSDYELELNYSYEVLFKTKENNLGYLDIIIYKIN